MVFTNVSIFIFYLTAAITTQPNQYTLYVHDTGCEFDNIEELSAIYDICCSEKRRLVDDKTANSRELIQTLTPAPTCTSVDYAYNCLLGIDDYSLQNISNIDFCNGKYTGSGIIDIGKGCLILISSEDDSPREFEISRRDASLSFLVRSIVEVGMTDKKIQIKIPIKKVRGDILELIVIYLKHHNGKKPQEIAKPIRSVKMERIVSDKWDADYINKMNKKTIFRVILGANYMDLPSLLHLGCVKIHTLIKGKSPEEIKNILADDSIIK